MFSYEILGIEKLEEVDKLLGNRIVTILQAMKYLGHEMMIHEALRTTERQKELYAQGRTKPGKIVTDKDGVNFPSKHQLGLAVDCVFVDENGKPTWSLIYPWKLYGEMGKSLGLRWLGDSKLSDMPHLELQIPEERRKET